MQINQAQCRRLALAGVPDPPVAESTQDDSAEKLVEQVLEMCKEQLDALTKRAQSPDSNSQPVSAPLPPMPQIQVPDDSTPGCGAPPPSCSVQGPSAPQDPDALLNQGQLSDTQKDAIMTLSRHEGAFSRHGSSLCDLADKARDPRTPPDLRKALTTVLNDPGLLHLVEDGDRNRISRGDIRDVASRPDMKAYSKRKAADYAQNYIPSGDQGKHACGRPITRQDAEQELYKYADVLPRKLSQHEFTRIIDGESDIKQRPPQLIAAAYYFKQHPDEWRELNNGSDKVRCGQMEDNISAKGELTQSEKSAVDRLTSDPNHVFGDRITRQSLRRIVADPKASEADKQAARTFLDDAVLFGKEDNAQDGRELHGAEKLWRTSDDGIIVRGDLEAFKRKLQDTKIYAPPAAAATTVAGTAAAAATADMLAGEADQPEMKKPKGAPLKSDVDTGPGLSK
jgi:type III secretion translocon protein HrpF